MDFDNTIQVMQNMGFEVRRKGKRILKKKKKLTKRRSLYKGFNYNVNKSKTGVELEFVFGKAKKYWQFVDEGVRGSGGFKGSGKARGKGSPFKFKSKNIKKGVIAKWIKNKPLKLRGADGRFIEKSKANIKSASFLIGRAIAQRGLERTQFFSKPFESVVEDNINTIGEAFSKDVENELELILEDINIEIIVKKE